MTNHKDKECPRSSNSSQRLLVMDATRAVAAISVFLFHYGFFSYGHLGVHLFFLLSGFVLTMPSRHFTAHSFARARCRRLYPAYWVCLALTFSVKWMVGERPAVAMIVANATMLTAFLGQEYMDGVYWSLTEELVFYALVAATGSFRSRGNALALAGMMMIVASAYPLLQSLELLSPGTARHASAVVKYLPFFGGGIACAAVYRQVVEKGGQRISLVTVTAMWILLAAPAVTTLHKYSLHLPSEVQAHEGIGIFFVFAAFYGVTALACYETLGLSKRGMLNCKPLTLMASFGACTYPFYLLHDQFGKVVAKLLGFKVQGAGGLLIVFLYITVLSVGIHLGIERRRRPHTRGPGETDLGCRTIRGGESRGGQSGAVS